MRHRKRTFKIGRKPAHRRAMMANLLKALIEHEKIQTTQIKAKELKRQADKMITLAKEDSLAAKRKAAAVLQLRYNHLTSKQAKRAKKGDLSVYNQDRKVLKKLFSDIKGRFETRSGGYTRILKSTCRFGDSAEKCIVELV